MHVVGHQAPGPYRHLRDAAALGEQITLEGIVGVAEECARAAIAALGNVVRMTGDDDTGEAGHASQWCERTAMSN